MGRKDREGYIDPRIQKAKDKYEGQIFLTHDKQMQFEVLEYVNSDNVIIHFIGTDYVVSRTAYEVTHGQVANPFPSSREGAIGAVHFDDLKKKWIGCQFKTKLGDMLQIIDYVDSDKVTVKFLDNFGYITTTKLCHIKDGIVGNPYHINAMGGYNGEIPDSFKEHPLYDTINQTWYNMLRRGIEENRVKLSYYHIYKNTIVVPEWYCFANFFKWYVDQLSRLNPNVTYELDKDLLYFKYKDETNGMRCYGPKYCMLLPYDLNTALPSTMEESNFICTYERVMRAADKYLACGGISKEVYDLVIQCLNYYGIKPRNK